MRILMKININNKIINKIIKILVIVNIKFENRKKCIFIKRMQGK